MTPRQFSSKLLSWHKKHGRHDLPWQHNTSSYRVWVSEIMLQQTQVTTVIDYYTRFMKRFKNVQALANAEIDEVLHLWTGLGYYARARNLHAAAIIVCEQYNGQFPDNLDAMIALPGIGRSTAAAVLALSQNQHQSILDGNVKRVLSRFYCVEGWYGKREVVQQLWSLSEQHTPKKHCAQYTQAIMDLGATLCRRSKPDCEHCPVQAGCESFATDRVAEFPHSKPKKRIPVRSTAMLFLRNHNDDVLLQLRPPSGIWGGLWSCPEADCATTAKALKSWCAKQLSYSLSQIQVGEVIRHTFSHFHLDITPVYARAESDSQRIMDSTDSVWYNTQQPDARGLAAPVKLLLQSHAATIQNLTTEC